MVSSDQCPIVDFMETPVTGWPKGTESEGEVTNGKEETEADELHLEGGEEAGLGW